MLITFDELKKKRADDFTQPPKIVPFFGITGKERDLSKSAPWQGSPRGGLGVWERGVRTLLAALPQPARQAATRAQHVVTASSILALAHLVAVNPKESIWTSWKCKTFLFSTVPVFFFFCINSISSFQRFLRTEVASRIKPAQF